MPTVLPLAVARHQEENAVEICHKTFALEKKGGVQYREIVGGAGAFSKKQVTFLVCSAVRCVRGKPCNRHWGWIWRQSISLAFVSGCNEKMSQCRNKCASNCVYQGEKGSQHFHPPRDLMFKNLRFLQPLLGILQVHSRPCKHICLLAVVLLPI